MIDENCIFCSIIQGKLSAERVYEDDGIIVIPDIHPIARLHYLVIPKEHYPSLAEMNAFQANNLALMLKKLPEISAKLGFTDGYRLIINQGPDAGQSVPHMHIHMVGGQKLKFEA